MSIEGFHGPIESGSLYKSFAHLEIVLTFFLLGYKSAFYYEDVSPLSYAQFANILSCSAGCILTFSMVTFKAQKVLILLKSSLSNHSSLVLVSYGYYIKKIQMSLKQYKFIILQFCS